MNLSARLKGIVYYLHTWRTTLDIDNRDCNSALLNRYLEIANSLTQSQRNAFLHSYLYTAARFRRLIRKARPQAESLSWLLWLDTMQRRANNPLTLYALASPERVEYATTADVLYTLAQALKQPQ